MPEGRGHPVDRLLERLWSEQRPPTAQELERIRARIAAAPFNPARQRVDDDLRGRTYLRRPIRAEERSLFIHLLQRVVRNRQWAYGTRPRQYLQDLRESGRSTLARLVLYEDGSDLVVGVIAPSSIIPTTRRGARWGPLLFVVYSARNGHLKTGYLVQEEGRIRLSEKRLWLRS